MARRIFFISVALSLFSLVVQEGVEEYHKANQVSVVLLTVDSLRQDMVGGDTTPNLLNALGAGYRAKNHRAVSGWTGANMISLLTGLSPFQAGVHSRGQSVKEDLRLPLKILSQRGYRVAGLQGFMAMDNYKGLGLDIRDIGSDPLFWLTERSLADEPFFLWEHYVYTHLPYRPGRGYKVDQRSIVANDESLERVNKVTRWTNTASRNIGLLPEDVDVLHALHKANVREFDDWFGEFWQFFCKSGLSGKTVLIVTADHGDEHGERGNVGHASTNGTGHLHGEIIRVPLFLWLPEKLQQKNYTKIFEYSDHLDVMVTLLTLLDIPIPSFLQGRDLLTTPSESDWAGMTSGGGFNEQDPNNVEYYEYGVIDDGWKLLLRIHSGAEKRWQLYKLTDDPGEENNLADKEPKVLSRLQSLLQPKIDAAQHLAMDFSQDTFGPPDGPGPGWVFPVQSGHYDHGDFDNGIYLQWQGDDDADYILQYTVGKGDHALEGQLDLHGPKIDFGTLSHRYWQTWIVPAGAIKVRVRRVDKGGWSDWLILEPLS